jgi:hypothetical protein
LAVPTTTPREQDDVIVADASRKAPGNLDFVVAVPSEQ